MRREQPLVTYDNIELGQLIGEYLSVFAERERLRTQQEVDRKFLERAQSLIEVEAIAQREFELRQAEYEQSRAAVESKRADLARIEEQLHRFGRLVEPDLRPIRQSSNPPARRDKVRPARRTDRPRRD